LHAKYYPLEVDRSLSLEERVKFMVEWVEQSHAAMLTSGLTRSKLISAVADANIALRDGHDVLLRHLEALSIPLLIFSAGIADVLEEVFKQHSEAPLPQHAHIVSNRMVFNEQSGALEGFTEDLFHVFNKQASSIQHAPYFQADGIDKRHNVILVGDSLGDVHMAMVSTTVF
jgi:cytosolic 5'-nucleotidase 3